MLAVLLVLCCLVVRESSYIVPPLSFNLAPPSAAAAAPPSAAAAAPPSAADAAAAAAARPRWTNLSRAV